MSEDSRRRRAALEAATVRIRLHLERCGASTDLLQDVDLIASAAVREAYGLVFEDHREPAETLAQNGDLALVERRALRVGSGERHHRLIEGENLLALTLLSRSLAGRVDVVSIDPPYNTGMNHLGYGDDHFTDADDQYRHSAWLSFMAKRLTLARALLSESGVLFLHVDENETGTAMLLSASVFGEGNTGVLIWPKTDTRFDQNRVEKPFRNIKMIHEYVIVCYRDKSRVSFNKVRRPFRVGETWEDRSVDMESIVGGWGTTSSAKDELGEVFGDRYRFQTPKPMRLIKEFIRAASAKDSIVLDFFAGSGTTGHAVMDLNREDGGSRTFYLVNNDENGICREVTYERLKRVIEREGYQESLRYYAVRTITAFHTAGGTG